MKRKITVYECDVTGERFEEGTEGSAMVRVDVVGEDYFRNLTLSPEAVKNLPNPEESRRKRPEAKPAAEPAKK